MYIGPHVKYKLVSSDFKETWIFSTDFRKIVRYQISQQSVRGGGELFHEDGRTDMTKLIVAFRSFANEPKKWGNSKLNDKTPIEFYVEQTFYLVTCWQIGVTGQYCTKPVYGHPVSGTNTLMILQRPEFRSTSKTKWWYRVCCRQ